MGLVYSLLAAAGPYRLGWTTQATSGHPLTTRLKPLLLKFKNATLEKYRSVQLLLQPAREFSVVVKSVSEFLS